MNSNILIVEDDYKLREALVDVLSSRDYKVFDVSNLQDAMKILSTYEISMVLSDINLSELDSGFDVLKYVKKINKDIPVVLITAYGDVKKAVDAMKSGASDYILKPFDPNKIASVIEKYTKTKSISDDSIIAFDKEMQSVISLVEKVSDTTVSILLIGESGTGKEVIAKKIHKLSSRAKQPFIAVNCAAIPETMLEAILFGYEKGAFTGAIKTTKGKFELGQGGTVFLDEISEMPLNLQAKFLRVLQEREVERLGGKDSISLDIRIISASNKDLYKEVKNKKFREDLYYRLNVFPVKLPSLSKRKKDIVPLAEKFINTYSIQYNKDVPILTSSAKKVLQEYDWPGNVRELENIIQRAILLCEEKKILAKDILIEEESKNTETESLQNSVQSVEQKIILKALKENDCVKQDTAKQLGISARTLRYKLAQMKEQGIEIPEA